MRELIIAYLVKNTSVKDFASYRKLTDAEVLEKYTEEITGSAVEQIQHLNNIYNR